MILCVALTGIYLIKDQARTLKLTFVLYGFFYLLCWVTFCTSYLTAFKKLLMSMEKNTPKLNHVVVADYYSIKPVSKKLYYPIATTPRPSYYRVLWCNNNIIHAVNNALLNIMAQLFNVTIPAGNWMRNSI